MNVTPRWEQHAKENMLAAEGNCLRAVCLCSMGDAPKFCNRRGSAAPRRGRSAAPASPALSTTASDASDANGSESIPSGSNSKD